MPPAGWCAPSGRGCPRSGPSIQHNRTVVERRIDEVNMEPLFCAISGYPPRTVQEKCVIATMQVVRLGDQLGRSRASPRRRSPLVDAVEGAGNVWRGKPFFPKYNILIVANADQLRSFGMRIGGSGILSQPTEPIGLSHTARFDSRYKARSD